MWKTVTWFPWGEVHPVFLSLWFWGRKANGRRSLYSFSGALPLILFVVPMALFAAFALFNLLRIR